MNQPHSKHIIYQIFPRLFGNQTQNPELNGTKEQNGCGGFENLTQKSIQSIQNIGFTHIWLTGILQHATQTAYPRLGLKSGHPAILKGKAGSPYAVTDFFELDPDLCQNPENRWKEFSDCVERIHNQGLKAIIDFIPNHTARQYKSPFAIKKGLRDLGENDFNHEFFHPNNHYYYLPDQKLEIPDNQEDITGNFYEEFPAKATGNDCFSAKPSKFDWYETVKLNYGYNYLNHHAYFYPTPATWGYMLEVLKFWADKKIDGFRCDMVEMVPVDFWAWAIPQIKSLHPNLIFIGEVYNPQLYDAYLFKGKFDFLYDKVGLYDQLRALVEGKGNADQISGVWQAQEGFGERMLRFMENHDEQRIASEFVGKNGMNALPAMAISAFMGKGPVMVYFGQELGEKAEGRAGFSGDDGKTTIFDYWTVSSIQRFQNKNNWDGKLLTPEETNLQNEYRKILNFCKNRVITQGLFYDLQYANQGNANYNSQNIYSFLRYSGDDKYLFINTFNIESSTIRIIIPLETWNTLGISIESQIRLTDPFDNQKPVDFFVRTSFWSEGNTPGILLPCKKFKYQIWKLNANR